MQLGLRFGPVGHETELEAQVGEEVVELALFEPQGVGVVGALDALEVRGEHRRPGFRREPLGEVE